MPVKEYTNRLINEKSPYLLQHAHNPVDWYPWGDEAFAKAKVEDKPVFLSIGYSTCHWCHVMERESFEDEEVARVLNEHFVSIKVDREERGDVDHFYMEACMAFNGHGGWPLTAFLDHSRRPFYSGTYFPKQDQQEMMGFLSVLDQIITVWRKNRPAIEHSGRWAMEAMGASSPQSVSRAPNEAVLKRACRGFSQSFDKIYGGFGIQPKFPSAHNLLFLLDCKSLGRELDTGDLVEKTLSAMACGGIFDHIGGGFFRYSTDREWLVPHFEKMLYDNAMLLMAYARGAVNIDPVYRETACRIVDYCRREMLDPSGGFYTAQDADSEGVEGQYYLWTPQQVADVLGAPAGEAFCQEYDVTPQGNFEGKSIPNRIGKGLLPMDNRHSLLLRHRDARMPPLKDDKVLASSNGLMIAALAASGRLLGQDEWVELARRAAEFVLDNLLVDGRLMARWRDGQAAPPAALDDYAYLLWGLTELYAATGEGPWLERALSLARSLLDLFGDEDGGLFLTGRDVTDLPLRQKTYYDGALPGGSAVAARCFFHLSAMAEEETFFQAGEELLKAGWSSAENAPQGHVGLLSALMQRQFGIHVSVSAGEGQERLLEVLDGDHPFLTVTAEGIGENSATLLNLFENKHLPDGRAAAWLCGPSGCLPPVSEPDRLRQLLDAQRSL